MKQRINILIVFSTVVLVGLIAIQCYLVKTTYDYKIAQFHGEIKEHIATITHDYSDIDSAFFDEKDRLYRSLATQYILNSKSGVKIKKALLQNQFREALTRKLQQEFKKEIPNLKMQFAIVLNKFVIYNSKKLADTIYSEKPSLHNKLYGDLNSLQDAFLVRNYVGTTSGNANNLAYKLLTEDSLYVSVKDADRIILKRMSLLLFFAIISILTIISLFVIAIKTLIKQKKISDIKTDFINNITHELKTPLSTLAISTKILERKDIRDNEIHFNNLVATIARQNNRLQQLIDQVVDNSLGENEITLQKEKIVSETFLNTIVQDFKLSYPKITISTEFKTEKTVLFLDKFHLTTAILNVLENAVKYGCTTIVLQTSLVNNLFNVSIQDDGIGILKNKHSLLFDKFYRVEKGNLHNVKGLGLGLYYVDQIVKAHCGKVLVISDLGKGSVFKISLPSM
jgi:two-component system, OmpR family, sensor histidine kinase VicK